MIIGGAACDLLFSEVELEFRATKDIDMVLIVESLTPEFGKRFWAFIEAGWYDHRKKSDRNPQYYRFEKPVLSDYPAMIELFSRRTDMIPIPGNARLTPILIDDNVLSLSAILLDDDYYKFLRNGIKRINQQPILDVPYLIPFKMRAWLDLTRRKAEGAQIDGKHIRKHRNDVFRLSSLLSAEIRVPVPSTVHQDIEQFLERMAGEEVNLADLSIRAQKDAVIRRLAAAFYRDNSSSGELF